jgi:hypothetical protein
VTVVAQSRIPNGMAREDVVAAVLAKLHPTRRNLMGTSASRVQHSAPCPGLVCRPSRAVRAAVSVQRLPPKTPARIQTGGAPGLPTGGHRANLAADRRVQRQLAAGYGLGEQQRGEQLGDRADLEQAVRAGASSPAGPVCLAWCPRGESIHTHTASAKGDRGNRAGTGAMVRRASLIRSGRPLTLDLLLGHPSCRGDCFASRARSRRKDAAPEEARHPPHARSARDEAGHRRRHALPVADGRQ